MLRPSLDYLLDIKLNTPEKSEIKPIKDIDDFLDTNVAKFDEIMKSMPKEEYRSWDSLNKFFISELYG